MSTSSSKTNVDLRSRLKQLQQEKRLLEMKLMSEKMTALMSASAVTVIADEGPNTGKRMDVHRIRMNVSPCMKTTAEQLLVKNLWSVYRFAGVTCAPYKKLWKCLRVDTYYNRRFYESYCIMFYSQGSTLELVRHNVPSFISIDNMAEQLLPTNIDLFTRAMTELLTAYVSRREQLNELKNHVDGTAVIVDRVNSSFTNMVIKMFSPSKPRHSIFLTYDNWASIYPTDVTIKDSDMNGNRVSSGEESSALWTDLVEIYKSNTLLKAYNMYS